MEVCPNSLKTTSEEVVMDRSTAGEALVALRFIVGPQGLIIQA